MDDPQIKAALIGAAATLAATLIALIGKALLDRRRRPDPPPVGFPPGEANEQIAAYVLDELSSTTTLHEDGRIENVREYRGVRSRTQGTVLQNQELPYKLNASSGTLGRPEVVDVRGLPTQLHIDTQTPLLIDARIELLGLLRADGRTDFDVLHSAAGMFLMTRKEVLEAYKNSKWKTEYQSLSTVVPTQLLRLTMRFPASFSHMSKPTCVVFEDQEDVHQRETDRIKNSLATPDATTACLTVENPIIGLRYAIAWMPPS